MFTESSVNKVINSFEDLRSFSKKCINSQTKAYSTLELWANENNNNAIQDISNKLSLLFHKFDTEFKNAKLDAFSNLTNVFRKFKEYDSQIKSEKKSKELLEKKEVKYFEKIQKCPANKSIRDYEVKYENAKKDRQKTEIMIFELCRDIDTTKSILFKKNMKQLVETLQQQNEAERVLLSAMQELIDQMPDISNEDVDDLNSIRYTKQDTTQDICNMATRRLETLSSSSLKKFSEQPFFHSSPETLPLSNSNIARIDVDFGGQWNKMLYPTLDQYTPPTTPPAYTASVWSSAGANYAVPSAPSLDQAMEPTKKKALLFSV